PPESVMVAFDATSPKSNLQLLALAGRDFRPATSSGSHMTFTVPAGAEKLVPVEIRLIKESGPAVLAIEYTTNEDIRPRPFPRRRRRNASVACLGDARQAAGSNWSGADARLVDVFADAAPADAARSSGPSAQTADGRRSQCCARWCT